MKPNPRKANQRKYTYDQIEAIMSEAPFGAVPQGIRSSQFRNIVDANEKNTAKAVAESQVDYTARKKVNKKDDDWG